MRLILIFSQNFLLPYCSNCGHFFFFFFFARLPEHTETSNVTGKCIKIGKWLTVSHQLPLCDFHITFDF